MRNITKALTIGAVIVAVGGIGMIAAVAETSGPGFGPGFMGGHMGPGMMGPAAGQRGFGFGDPAARLGALKAELGVRPEQAAAWDAYAKVVLDAVTQMRTTRENMDMNAVHDMAPQDRFAFMSALRDQHVQASDGVTTAAQALLATLDDSQKAKAKSALPGLAEWGPGGMQQGGFAMMGHGMGMMRGPMGGPAH